MAINKNSTTEEIIDAVMEAAEGDNGILTAALAKKLSTAINRQDIRVLFSSYLDAQRLRTAFSNKVSAVRRTETELAKKIVINLRKRDTNDALLSKLSERRFEALLEEAVVAKTAEIAAFYADISAKNKKIENLILSVIDALTYRFPIGQWMRAVPGVGPVTTAAIISYLDIRRAPSANHFWSAAGLNPEQKWEKGQLRPFNQRLKSLLWNLGETFVKKAGDPYDVYGKLINIRKRYESAKNDAGEYADFAYGYIKQCKDKHLVQIETYRAGRLPGSHIHARGKRYAVKIFLAHVWEVWYQLEFNRIPPDPYPLAHQGHVHKLKAPFWDPVKRRILPPPVKPKGAPKYIKALTEALNRNPSIGEFEQYCEDMGTPVTPVPPISADALIESALKDDREKRRENIRRVIGIFNDAVGGKLEDIEALAEEFENEFYANDATDWGRESHTYTERRRGEGPDFEAAEAFDDEEEF